MNQSKKESDSVGVVRSLLCEYIIVLKLPDGLNFYCGKTKWEGHYFDTWDLDIRYGLLFTDKLIAKKICSMLKRSKGQEGAKVRDFRKFKKRLLKSVKISKIDD